jgi:hypothetical protein
MASSTEQDTRRLTHLRRRRHELRRSMSALEHALASPVSTDAADWAAAVRGSLLDLASDLRVHITITEGPDGLYAELERHAPRLAGTVEQLIREHLAITRQVEQLLQLTDEAEDGQHVGLVRRLGVELFVGLMHHRQRDADVVFEAYDFDVGGES